MSNYDKPYGWDPDFSVGAIGPMDLGKVQKLFDELDEAEVLGDRREYSVKDLEQAYSFLNHDEVRYLYRMIQDQFDPDLAISLDDIPAEVFKRYCLDTIHNGFDGWEMNERPLVQAVFNDIKRNYKMDHTHVVDQDLRDFLKGE